MIIERNKRNFEEYNRNVRNISWKLDSLPASRCRGVGARTSWCLGSAGTGRTAAPSSLPRSSGCVLTQYGPSHFINLWETKVTKINNFRYADPDLVPFPSRSMIRLQIQESKIHIIIITLFFLLIYYTHTHCVKKIICLSHCFFKEENTKTKPKTLQKHVQYI